eukprot:g13799.t1
MEGVDVGSLTVVADYIRRTDGQAATREDRDRARESVVIRAESRMPRSGATHNPFADSLLLSDEALRTTGSLRGTSEATNAMVIDPSSGKRVRAGPYLKKAAALRRDIPNDMDDERAGSSIKRERGIRRGLNAKDEGFQAKLKASIDLRTGRILPHVGGTVPAVEVDGEWVVPDWALWFISR